MVIMVVFIIDDENCKILNIRLYFVWKKKYTIYSYCCPLLIEKDFDFVLLRDVGRECCIR